MWWMHHDNSDASNAAHADKGHCLILFSFVDFSGYVVAQLGRLAGPLRQIQRCPRLILSRARWIVTNTLHLLISDSLALLLALLVPACRLLRSPSASFAISLAWSSPRSSSDSLISRPAWKMDSDRSQIYTVEDIWWHCPINRVNWPCVTSQATDTKGIYFVSKRLIVLSP